MKYLYFLFLCVLSIGCSKRWCYTRYPLQSDTLRIETIRDSIIYKDTIVYITLPGETVIDSIPIPCPEVPGYIPQKVYAETSLAKASAWWSFPVIKLELIQKDTTIERRLDNAIRESYHWKSLYEKLHIVPPPVKYIPKIYKQAMSICIFIFSCGFLFIGWRAYKFFKR